MRSILMRSGAPGRVRTRDPLITNQVLYQLSYKGNGRCLGANRFAVKQKIAAQLAQMVNLCACHQLFTARRSEPIPGRNGLWLQVFVMYHLRTIH